MLQDTTITDEAFQPVFDRIWWHTVQFMAFDGEEPSERDLGQPRGMGTLVNADGPCILTAAHVWERAREKRLFGVFLERNSKPRLLQRSYMAPRLWPGPEDGKWGQWGPDLVLIGLSELDTSDLKARGKAFFSLDTPRMDSEAPWWALIGTILAEVPRPTATGLDLPMHLYPSPIAARLELGGFDYLEVPAHFRSGERPASYGGVSGSGLWRFGMKRSHDGSAAWDESISLEGVAFHEIYDTPEKPGVIRCHGRKSIERARALSPEPADVMLVGVSKTR